MFCRQQAQNKGYSTGAFTALGFFFGVIGLIIALVLPNKNIENVKMQSDNADSLVKYKKLLDDGVITQEEFDAMKKELL